MGKFWCGLDLGEATAHVCVVGADGAIVLETVCPPQAVEIHQALAGFHDQDLSLIGMEAGGSPRLTRELRAIGYRVAVFEVRTARRFLEAFHNKTDPGDAWGIAEIARHGGTIVTQVYVKSPECQLLKSELLLRQKMLQQRLAAQGIMRSLFKLHADQTVPAAPGAAYRASIEKLLLQLKAEGLDISDQVLPVLEVQEGLSRYLRATDQKLAKLAKSHPVCGRLMTIPGVGYLTALSFYCAVEDPNRFERIEAIGPYLGLVPRVHQSGTMKRRLGISKRGNKMTRTLLTLGARSLMRPQVENTAIKEWGLQVAERSGNRKAQVAVARKLAIVMLAVWKNGRDYQAFPRAPASDPVASSTLPSQH